MRPVESSLSQVEGRMRPGPRTCPNPADVIVLLGDYSRKPAKKELPRLCTARYVNTSGPKERRLIPSATWP